MHLTNNSIQKYHKTAVLNDTMWDMKTFSQYIGEQKWRVIQEKIKNIIVWSIKACEGSVTGKRGFFQMVGYDFMIDENLNPWIIEINMSPSMDHSTPVSKKLVKMVQRDMGNFLSSSQKKKQKNAGLFSCIYRNEQDLQKYKMYVQ